MKHISLFFLLCVLSFGATSELVVPKGNDTIIDIGRNYKPSNMELPKEKEIKKYAASVREVASIVNMKNRDIHMTECVVDKNNKEGCPLNTVQCVNNICPIDSKIACVLQSTEDGLINVVGNYIYEGGLSTEIKKVSVKPKECTNGTLVGDICIGKTVPACESGYELNGDKCERVSRTNAGLVQDIVPSGYGGCTDGFSVGAISGNKYNCEKSMANGNCPSGFSLLDGKCKREESGLSIEYSDIVTDYANPTIKLEECNCGYVYGAAYQLVGHWRFFSSYEAANSNMFLLVYAGGWNFTSIIHIPCAEGIPPRTAETGLDWVSNLSSPPSNKSCQVSICPDGYVKEGNSCKKNYGYFYYDYSCPTEYGYIQPKNEGLTSCLKSDPMITAINEELADNCNSPVAPNNNCSLEAFPSCSKNQEIKKINGKEFCSYSSSPVCPAGTEMISTTECLSNSWNCPAGYVSDSKGCLKKDANCTTGETLVNGVCTKEPSLACENEYKLDKEKKQCYKEGTCPIGYTDMGATCVRNYSWFEYSCPAGYEGPFEKGFDCEGTKDVCNSPTPPQSNCKKPISLNSTYETNKTYRDLELHPIIGDVSIGDYGAYKDLICGNECNFNIKKITGENSDICFYKNNGFKECITVRGCYFSGSIENFSHPYEITDLYAPNQNTIALTPVNESSKIVADDSLISCPEGLFYNKDKKYCSSPSVVDFYKWKKEGDPSYGNWNILGSGTELLQTVNELTTLFLHPNEFSNETIMKGKIKGNIDHYNSIGLAFGFKNNSDFYVIDWGNGWAHYYTNMMPNYKDLNLIKVSSASESYGPYFRSGSVTLASASNIPWVAGRWYDIKMVLRFDNIKIYIDEILYIDYTLPSGQFPSGRAGFYNLSTPNVSYKDFIIESKPICPAGFTYDAYTRYCYQPQEPAKSDSIKSTCKINGHVGWLNRTEGIVSIKSEKDRILFWDSFKDRYLGAFEFVRDVKDEDKKDGYVAEKVLPYEMLAKGFTSIGTNEGKTYYTSAESIDQNECLTIANKMSLTKENVTGNNDFLKTLTGNRFKELKIEPKCESGFYSTAAKSCIDLYSTKDTSCAYGKYDKITTFSGSMQKSMVYNHSQGASNTVYSAIVIKNPGLYRVKIGGLGSTSVYINNNLVASVSGGSEKLENINLNPGLYEVKVVSSGIKGWAVEIYDDFLTLMSSSENWCKQTPNSYCPEDGFVKVGNLCLEKRLNDCTSGTFNDDSGLCILPPKCILSGPIADFQSQTKAMKSETLDKSKFKSMCSSLVCDGGMCGTATCPSGFSGSQFPYGTTIPTGTCISDVCDANKDYYEYCGQPNGCDKTNPLVYEASNGKCYELYCPAGKIMNVETKNCETF